MNKIFIWEKILDEISKRWLLKQYEKVEKFLKEWKMKNVDFRLRNPKSDNIYYFKINKQYRLWCTYKNNEIKIFHFDKHNY